MKNYLEMLQKIIDEGILTPNRTGVSAKGIWGHMLRFNLAESFPLLTTKKIHFPSVVAELVFFLRGYTDVRELQKRGCRIWNEWATKEHCAKRGVEEFDLGPVYGWQWRHFGAQYVGMKNEGTKSIYAGQGFDQLLWAQNELRNNPGNRQIIMSAWNPNNMAKQALPACHVMVHFRAVEGRLNTLMLQRSCDSFLGVPFNIASYALLTEMMAQTTGLKPGEFVHILNDVHIYENHFSQVRTQLAREPLRPPDIILDGAIKSIEDFDVDSVRLTDYEHHPAISATVAV